MNHSTLSFPDVSGLDPEEAKQQIRPIVRASRSARSTARREELEEEWIATAMKFIGDAELVAAFVSVNEEPPSHGLIQTIADSGKRVILPKLGPGLTRAWGYFRGLDDLEEMAPGRPPEPTGPAFDNDLLADVDALIIPALAVSHTGARIGQGGGWYDRALKLAGDRAKIGAMVFPEEFVDAQLPQDDNDVRVPYVILPDRIVATTN
ncbi:5-formyltetrahydrofolate cyclo-ligase [Arcanobacterium canis]|uniref:5-formyltetrahydrofolate cyclo-ligase n=1 Tax=Arcanobacterium canis TaxID=999183 RepID=A0ABY8G118_9ACTO|nr:5-formyltetrahydrofolate cyclo-ligase [Arcanobacterium canis]WFM83625.1 5-formyltetrahydrofolate cyclo-ligase [Arcanobacterium canis]